ncbi:MAG TPA: class I SAM-dependent methyltransferase [Gemmatimonadaceae bacterium]
MGIGNVVERLYWRLESWIAPGVRFAQSDFEECLSATIRPGDDWLDVGCGHNLLPEWRAAREQELISATKTLVGLDPEFAALRNHRSIRLLICGDAGNLPFATGSFDMVTANMVVEHLPDPHRQFREIARVLKPGGRFVFHTPNSNGYPTLMARLVPDRVRALAARTLERRPAEDRFPTFYRANTPAAIRSACQEAGLVPDRIDLVRSTAMFWMITPIAILELFFLRMLGSPDMATLRPNLIAVLKKPD